MPIKYLKKADKTASSNEDVTRQTVAEMLKKIESGGEEAAQSYGRDLDNYNGEIIVSEETIARAAHQVSQQLKDDLNFAHDRVRDFAVKQKESINIENNKNESLLIKSTLNANKLC